MKRDSERLLRALTPRGAGPDLRGRVLAAVGRELARVSAALRWERRAGWAVAASLLLGAALNALAVRHELEWRARLLGPPPEPRVVTEVVASVESVTDPQAAEWFRRYLTRAHARRPRPAPAPHSLGLVPPAGAPAEKGEIL
jgi:hypothetical protein